MLAAWKDKSEGTVTLPQPLCGRKRQGRSSPKSCEHTPAHTGPGDTLAPRASDGGDSLVHSQHAGVRGNAVCKYTAITAPRVFGPRLCHRRSGNGLLVDRGDSGGCGQWEDEDAHSHSLSSPQLALLVIYNLIQMTVSELKDPLYRSFIKLKQLIFRVLFCSYFSRKIKITKPAIKTRYSCIYLFNV